MTTLEMTRINQSFQLVFHLGEDASVLFIKKMVKIFTSIKNYFFVDYLRTIFSITSYFTAYPKRKPYSKKFTEGQFLNLRKQLLKYLLNDRLFANYLKKQLLLTRLVLQKILRNSKIISDDNTQSLKLLILN